MQYAVKDGTVFVIEANPRASRTVPFVSKATGVPLAKVAARVMLGATLAELRAEGLLHPPAEGGHVSVKEAVLPFNRFPDVDTVLGPEMRSTGEVMGIDRTFGMAFAKSQSGAGNTLPRQGTVFLSLADRDKDNGLVAARRFAELGFAIAATAGTADMLERAGIAVDTVVAKVGEQVGVDAVDLISSGKVDLVVNTPRGRGPRTDGMHIRRAAIVARRRVRHHRRGRARGRGRDRRGGAERARGALAAGVPPRQPAEARAVSRAGGRPWSGAAIGRAGRPRRRSRAGAAPEPDRGRVGHVRSRRGGRGALRSARPRRGDREVGRRVRVVGESAAARHRSARRRDAQLGRASRSGRRRVDRARPPALEARGARVIASIWGRSADEYAAAARPLKAVAHRLVAIEVNLSCPNVEARGDVFAHSERRDARRDARGRRVDRRRGADVREALTERHRHRRDRARRARRGRDRAHAGQLGDGIARSTRTRARRAWARAAAGSPVPPIKPIALRAVWDVSREFPDVPIIGTGGVSSGVDAVEMMLAGATAVGVGTATFADPRASLRIAREMEEWCAANRVRRVRDLIGGMR